MPEIDITTLLQKEATQNQYIFNFVWMNLVFIVAYFNRNRKAPIFFTWMLILIFVLYAFWDTDYFSFRYIFHTSLEGFRDPFYYYISLISFNSYTIFRLLIWGTGLLLFHKTAKRFNLRSNYTAYIFVIFFLLTFSYARVSLGMALYFYGLSYLLKPNQQNQFGSFVWGLIFIGCSYWGHRSMLALILLTPIAFINLNKRNLITILVIGTLASGLAATLLSDIITGTLKLDTDFGGAGEAAEQYANIEVEIEYNWKFTLMRYLRFASFYIAIAYAVWKSVFTKYNKVISNEIKRLILISLCIMIFAVSFMVLPSWGAEIIGYRYLYMLGIPVCLILSYFGSKNIASPRTIQMLLILAFLYSEGFIFGKILSF
ncbi:MAG: EpsG family protein [Alistipes sp.]|nr:EpsG family protein [Alistipes sp.]